MNVIEQIEQHCQRIADGSERVYPGMPMRFTEACVPGDCIWQGDLGLVISDSKKPPNGYVKPEKPSVQLVPGNTVGSKHCLDTLDGVEMYVPKKWNEETLDGPFLVIEKEVNVLHPTHGTVTIPAGFNVQCYYQREYDRELERERRARD
jgi:hypothetical protein